MKGHGEQLARDVERHATPCKKPEACDCDDCRASDYRVATVALEGKIMLRLSELPSRLAAAEERVLQSDEAVQVTKTALQAHEDNLILGGSIEGKNEAARAAALRLHTQKERDAVTRREAVAARARLDLRVVQAEFNAAKAMARLLAGGEER